jgi:hypothetical protein
VRVVCRIEGKKLWYYISNGVNLNYDRSIKEYKKWKKIDA